MDVNYVISIPGYKFYRADRNSSGGGVALLIKNSIDQSEISLPDSLRFEAIGVVIRLDRYQICLIQVYVPPKKNIVNDDLDRLFLLQKRVMIMGDLNARHRAWNCYSNNAKGNFLLNYCFSKNLSLLAPEFPTHFPKIGRPSILDIFLAHNSINTSKPYSLSSLNSDHNPVLIYILEKPVKSSNLVQNYKLANWRNFKNDLDREICLNFHITTKIDVEDKVNDLLNIIRKAVDNNIPLINLDNSTYNFPAPIKSLIRLKNRYRRIWQKQRSETNHANLVFLQK